MNEHKEKILFTCKIMIKSPTVKFKAQNCFIFAHNASRQSKFQFAKKTGYVELNMKNNVF